MNCRKPGLRLLIKRICSGGVGRLALTPKDRLLRFGADLISSLCEIFGTEIVIINTSEESSFEDQLVLVKIQPEVTIPLGSASVDRFAQIFLSGNIPHSRIFPLMILLRPGKNGFYFSPSPFS